MYGQKRQIDRQTLCFNDEIMNLLKQQIPKKNLFVKIYLFFRRRNCYQGDRFIELYL